jgi:ring-1,2-phenylacetyl-CoA epoxidase subunit PaaC
MQAAIDGLWPYTGELFEPGDVDAAMLAARIGPDPRALRDPWLRHVGETLADATLTMPAAGFMHRGGKSGRHGEALSYLLAELQSVRRSVPGDRW